MTKQREQSVEEWKEFEKTNPRATLLEGHLYFREEDVKSFVASLIKKHQDIAYETGLIDAGRSVERAVEKERERIVEIVSEFEKEFVQDNGNNVESSFKDPNGDAGLAIKWLRQTLTTALAERDREIVEEIKKMEKKPYDNHVGHDTGKAYDMGKSNGYNSALADIKALLTKDPKGK